MNVILMTGEGYPHLFSANNSKSEFIARGLKECGCSVTIIDGAFGAKGIEKEISGVSDSGIKFHILPRKGRYTSFFQNLPKLWKILKDSHDKEGKNHIIIGMSKVPFLYVYFFMAWVLGYSRSCLFHEWHVGFENLGLISKIEAYVRDYSFGFFVNAIFPISHFLQGKCNKFNKKMMLVPVLADYSMNLRQEHSYDHFTYCCAGEYLLRNTLVLDAFKEFLKKSQLSNIKLTLVLQGNDCVLSNTKKLIDSYHLGQHIVVMNKVPRLILNEIFESSIGLLIPLDPNSLQDKARFSQKIAEYVAMGRPIITTEYGEIPFYFKDKNSAIFASYDAQGFCDAMIFLAENPIQATRIGECGFQVGLSQFDYRTCGKNLHKFMEEI